MYLYKYRSFKNWNYILDIILNNRLYATTFDKMNDPMEGLFSYTAFYFQKEIVDSIKNAKMKVKICSLSKTYQEVLLWSHYADSHKGICIELKVLEDIKIRCEDVHYETSIPHIFFPPIEEPDIQSILLCKSNHWAYEQEYRCLLTENDKDSYVPIRISRIFVGCMVKNSDKKLLQDLLKRIGSDIEIVQMDKKDLISGFEMNVR